MWDGSRVPDTGLWCVIIPGFQCCGLVPFTSLLSPKPFNTGHKHTRPVPGKTEPISELTWVLAHVIIRVDFLSPDCFQNYFSRGGAPFIGMIVSPYDPANPSLHSQTTCLLVKESQEPSGPQSMSDTHTHTQRHDSNIKTVKIKKLWNQADNVGQWIVYTTPFILWLSVSICSSPELPYRFDFLSSQDIPDWEQTMRRAQWIVHKYAQTPGWARLVAILKHVIRCWSKLCCCLIFCCCLSGVCGWTDCSEETPISPVWRRYIWPISPASWLLMDLLHLFLFLYSASFYLTFSI